MSEIVNDFAPVTLAEFESLIPNEQAAKKVFVHTIRDYMPFFDQAAFAQASDGTRDTGSIVTEYPEAEARGYNEGWGSAVVGGRPAIYETAMFRISSNIDREMKKKKGADFDTYRLRRDQVVARGLARQMVRKVFGGSRSEDGRDVLGLESIVTKSNEAFADRIIDAGGTTANKQSDIWLIDWDDTEMHLTYPEGSSAPGFEVEDMGLQRVLDKKNKPYWAYVTEFGWDLGVSVFNPSRIVRITNVDVTKLSKSHTAAGTADIIDLLAQAANLLPSGSTGKTSFYMNDTLSGILIRQMQNRPNNMLNWDTVAGREGVLKYGNIPVHKLGTDVLLNTNAVA